jgi:hypothetical protein
MKSLEKKQLNDGLLNDLVSVVTVMEEVYRYHPENPKKINIIQEYENLKIMKDKIEQEINKLEV